MFKLRITTVLFCLFCLGLAVPRALAQQPATTPAPVAASPEVPYLRAIFEEVRQLRALVQQTAVSSLRARLLSEQLAKQQNRVDTLTEEVNQLKALLAQAQDATRGEEDLQELEIQIREAHNPQEADRLRQAYAAHKRALERERAALKKEAVEQQTRQMQLESALRLEQARLAELQGQLDELDRGLEKLAAEGKAKR